MALFVLAAPTARGSGLASFVADRIVTVLAAVSDTALSNNALSNRALAVIPVHAASQLEELAFGGAAGSLVAPTAGYLQRVADVATDQSAAVHRSARELIAESPGIPVLCHPELCTSLSFWAAALPGEHLVIFLRQNPAAVVEQIADLADFTPRYAMALWERWTTTAIRAAVGHRTVVVDAAELGDPDSRAVADLASALGGVVDGVLDASAARQALAAEPSISSTISPPASAGDGVEQTAQQVALAAFLQGLDGVHEDFAVVPPKSESEGAEFAFQATAAVLRNTGSDRAAAEERTDALLADVRAEAAKEHSATVAEFDAVEAQLHAELDRLRDIAAASEGDFAGGTDLARQLEVADTALAEAIHTRNVAAQQLELLRQRPAVKWSVRVANQTGRVLDAARDRHADAPELVAPATAPAAPAETDWTYLAERVRAGVFDRPVTVIVPIYNAVDAVQRCVEALDTNTPVGVNIVLIDDASTDPRLDTVLDQIRDRDGVTVLRNIENRGFTGTVNRGLDHAPAGDVVLLNSDTQVTPRWLWRLRVAANERPNIATVTPLSDHAGVFSFACPEPEGRSDLRVLGAAVARGAKFLRPTSPTGNGFAMFISQEAREAVPVLDVEAFPRGYGEENDFCMKLRAHGFEHVIADDAVVFHQESASFGDEQREALIREGLEVLAERYPEYDSLAQTFVASAAFQQARTNAAKSVASLQLDDSADARPRVLSVLHAGGGGTEFHARDLADAIIDDFDTYLLRPFGDSIELWRHAGEEWAPVETWTMSRNWDVRRFRDPEVAAVILEVFTRFDIEIVHVQHLIGLTLDLPELAAGLGIPLIMSLHDYYVACPSVNLLDNNVEYCGGVCTPGEGSCQVPIWVPVSLPLKHRFVHLWRHETRGLFDIVPRFVTPSEDARRNLLSIFGDEVGDRISVIEHGLEIDRPRSLARFPKAHEPVRILLVGGINQAKGAAFAHKIAAAGAARGVTVELLGKVEPGFEGNLVCHGEYQRDELPQRIAEIRPTFVGVFSVWPETHCYVVSEAWACGVPLLVGPLGAPVERVHEHGGGVVVDELDADAVVDKSLEIGRDRRRYNELASQARADNVRTLDEMGRDWVALYANALASANGRERS